MRCSSTGFMIALDYIRDPSCSHETHQCASKRLYDCFTINGGPYIKMGQMIAQMGQLVPAEYSKQFEALCNAAPQTDFDSVRQIVTEELAIKSIDEYFSEFDPIPVASASLA